MRTSVGSFPCRLCGTHLEHRLVDLGVSPLCESYVAEEDYAKAEAFYPLQVFVCHKCHLAQLDSFVPAEEIFGEYAYFSSYSDSWVEHARRYCHSMTKRFGLGPSSQVVEVASNDGYLLQHFVDLGIPCYGIEPAANIARVATEKGISTEVAFFGTATASRLFGEGGGADLILGKNVLAHVPDLNDFVAGLKIMLKPGGVMTMEFPHLLATMQANQFDQIYHEHYCYFSCLAAEKVFARHGIVLFDVEEYPTHGGSIRIFGRHVEETTPAVSPRLIALKRRELAAGLHQMGTYERWGEQVKETKRRALDFLIAAARAGRRVAAYGAPGKGNTFLNYCGIGTDFISFTVDRNPYKQGKYLPGSRIPIHPPEKLREARPETIVILPWNLRDEIAEQIEYTAEWGAELVVFIPEVTAIASGSSGRRNIERSVR